MTDPSPPLWIADQVRNDGRRLPSDVSVKVWVTLTFDSSPIKGEGDDVAHRWAGCRPVDSGSSPE